MASRDKKQLILDAAETLFTRFGFSKTSIDEIAHEACLGKGTIYYYYESKEDIFLEVAKEHAKKFMQHLKDSINAEKDFAGKLHTIIILPVKLAHENSTVLSDVLKNLPIKYLQKLKNFRDQNKHLIIELLNDILKEGIKQKVVSKSIPKEQIVNIIYDWILLGDANIVIQNPEEFVKKAEKDYQLLIQLILYGLIKRGKEE